MEYSTGMHTVVETPQYFKASESIFSEAERTDIVNMVATDPECGDVMEGTGGFRKVPSSSLAFLLKTKRAI